MTSGDGTWWWHFVNGWFSGKNQTDHDGLTSSSSWGHDHPLNLACSEPGCAAIRYPMNILWLQGQQLEGQAKVATKASTCLTFAELHCKSHGLWAYAMKQLPLHGLRHLPVAPTHPKKNIDQLGIIRCHCHLKKTAQSSRSMIFFQAHTTHTCTHTQRDLCDRSLAQYWRRTMHFYKWDFPTISHVYPINNVTSPAASSWYSPLLPGRSAWWFPRAGPNCFTGKSPIGHLNGKLLTLNVSTLW